MDLHVAGSPDKTKDMTRLDSSMDKGPNFDCCTLSGRERAKNSGSKGVGEMSHRVVCREILGNNIRNTKLHHVKRAIGRTKPIATSPRLTCFAPHPAERITALATSFGGFCPPPHTVKPLMFFIRNRSVGRERCSIVCFGIEEHAPNLSMWMKDASSQMVRPRS